MKRGIILISVFFLTVAILNITSAEVMISQPKAVYNLNDMIDVSVVVKATSNLNDFIDLELVCGNLNKMFYFSPISLSIGQEEKINKKLLLSNSFLAGMQGQCMITAKYALEGYSSQIFKISDKINVVVNAEKTSLNPGENVEIKGSAIKENSQNVEGFVEASVEKTEMRFVSSVSQGKININFSFPDNAKSGSYKLKIRVYEKVNGEITNSGEESLFVSVKQEPRKIEIATDKQNVIPGESITFKPVIYDQAGDEISSEIKIEIIDSSGKVYLSKLIESGQESELLFNEDTRYGSWKLKASALGLASEREFNIEQLEKAKFSLVNDTLTITNIGNVPYKKAVQISIGNEVEVVEMNLDVGESKTLRLTGEGVFDISVSDGKENIFTSNVPLLGGVIGVKEIRSSLGLINKYPFLWLFLIVIFGLFIMTMSKRVIKGRFYSYAPKEDYKIGKSGEGFEKLGGKVSEIAGIKLDRNIKQAEHSLVLQGNKEEAGIIVLKIKNLSDLSKNRLAIETIEKVIEEINSNKGTLNKSFDSYTGIFVPSVTKTFKNDLIAVKVASAIAAHLNEHNKKFKDKIEYGIGINSGELAVRIEQGRLKFTPLGNAINLARKVAESADKNALLTSNVNKKVANDVKTLKQGEFYSISRIIERESNKDFINKFRERNQFG